MKPEVFDEAIAELHAFIEDNTARIKRSIEEPTSYSIKSSSNSFNDGWEIGFKRCLSELKRLQDKEKYEVKFGNAGFVIVYKNGERMNLKNKTLEFNK